MHAHGGGQLAVCPPMTWSHQLLRLMLLLCQVLVLAVSFVRASAGSAERVACANLHVCWRSTRLRSTQGKCKWASPKHSMTICRTLRRLTPLHLASERDVLVIRWGTCLRKAVEMGCWGRRLRERTTLQVQLRRTLQPSCRMLRVTTPHILCGKRLKPAKLPIVSLTPLLDAPANVLDKGD